MLKHYRNRFSKAIVTGANGFIARPLILSLIREGIPTFAVYHNEKEWDIPSESAQITLSKKGALDPYLDEHTVIFHLSGRVNVGLSSQDPRGDFEANFFPIFELLESARKTNASVIFPSTASIFDGSNSLPLSEDGLYRPSSPYGAAKLSGEAYCIAYHRSFDLDVKIVRLFSVYGPGMHQFVIYDIFKKILENPRLLTLLGKPDVLRDYLFIDDCVEGLWKLATQGSPGEIYHLASGQPTTINQLAEKMKILMGFPDMTIEFTGQTWKGDTQWYADISKIKALGFEPKVPLEEGLHRTISWLKKSSDVCHVR